VLVLVLTVKAVLRPDFPSQIAAPSFLLAVVFAAWFGGKGPGIFTAVLSYLTLDYFFLPPVYFLDPGWEDIPTAAVYLISALIVSVLDEQRRRATEQVRGYEERMNMARTIQARSFPSVPPQMDGLDIAGACQPAEATSGDYFDFIPMRDGKMGIVLADVSGHGFGSALVMAETRAYLRALATAHDNLEEILTRANDMLASSKDDQLFVTLFMGCIHPAFRSLVYAGAGHEAFLLHANGVRDRLESTCLPLGVAKDAVVPRAFAVSLDAGDILLLCTDGIFEAKSVDGEAFGVNRAIEAINSNRTKPAAQVLHRLFQSVREFSSHRAQSDDMTAVIVKADGEMTPRPLSNAAEARNVQEKAADEETDDVVDLTRRFARGK
jgi:sigma-B regulation protein RsbU (phosphoserine phosphatase)